MPQKEVTFAVTNGKAFFSLARHLLRWRKSAQGDHKLLCAAAELKSPGAIVQRRGAL